MKFFLYLFFTIICSNLFANSHIQQLDEIPDDSFNILNDKDGFLFSNFILDIDFEIQDDLNHDSFLEKSKLSSDHISHYQWILNYEQSNFENGKILDFENEWISVFNHSSQSLMLLPQIEKMPLEEYDRPSYTAPRTTSMEFLYYLGKGTIFNDLLLYKEAINVLSEAIRLNPLNPDVYIERASAYFETNQLSLALKDYEQAKKLRISTPFKQKSQSALMMEVVYIPDDKTKFAQGLVAGTLDGAKDSVNEFIPSVLSCCRGMLNGLWAFVLSPSEVSQEMINTAYAVGEFIAFHSTAECLECVVPELGDLSLTWDKINDYLKGQKIGYIIGKYGIDIFAPVGVLKGVNKVRGLKRANTICTLEGCTISKAKQAKILEESHNFATKRQIFISEISNKGKIYPKNANAIHHILQEKHAWEKIVNIKKPIKAKGNIEINFKSVIELLEKEEIMSAKYFTESVYSDSLIQSNRHIKIINGHKVEVFFEINTETNTTLIQNAWVITK